VARHPAIRVPRRRSQRAGAVNQSRQMSDGATGEWRRRCGVVRRAEGGSERLGFGFGARWPSGQRI
jgi:hypothetical protein